MKLADQLVLKEAKAMAACSISPSSSSSFSIGNCKVQIEGGDFVSEKSREHLIVSISSAAKIKISVEEVGLHKKKRWSKKSCMDLLSRIAAEESENLLPPKNSWFLLLNPKDVDSCSKLQLQNVLALYKKELPTMSYAANTGKKSLFLERCVSKGKYRTLIFGVNAIEGCKEVIAAISYQIIPVDTQYAEIPLAAVTSNYQQKGVGKYAYAELRKRLQNVGVLTIFCWADKESEGFWLKQGFVPIAEVDNKGRAHKLPIRSEIRRVLCFPGGSMLMVSHLNKDTSISAKLPLHAKKCPLILRNSLTSPGPGTVPGVARSKDCSNPPHTKGAMGDSIVSNFQSVGTQLLSHSYNEAKSKASVNDVDQNEAAVDLQIADGCEAAINSCSCSGLSVKRKVWQASCSSIKSKKVKGGHHVNCNLGSDGNHLDNNYQQNYGDFHHCLLEDAAAMKLIPESTDGINYVGDHNEDDIPLETTSRKNHSHAEMQIKRQNPVIMLMNIAEENKKACLTKIIEELGGSVSANGSSSTHVVTRKTRRTLNLCTALCSGAWIISPEWLKASFKKGAFIEESSYILRDKEYEMKYKLELKDAVFRAKERPNALLNGYDIYLAANAQLPVKLLTDIVKSAGGNVLRRIEEVRNPSRTILVACEEDLEAALEASKRGIWVYSSEWFIGCVMKQKLDFEAPQFAESL